MNDSQTTDHTPAVLRCDGCGRLLAAGRYRLVAGVGIYHEECTPALKTVKRLLDLQREIVALREELARARK